MGENVSSGEMRNSSKWWTACAVLDDHTPILCQHDDGRVGSFVAVANAITRHIEVNQKLGIDPPCRCALRPSLEDEIAGFLDRFEQGCD